MRLIGNPCIRGCFAVFAVVWSEGTCRGGQAPDCDFTSSPSFEADLRGKLTVYVYGIWPQAERLKEAIPAREIPEEYCDRVEACLSRVVRPTVLRGDGGKGDPFSRQTWIAVRGLHLKRNFIIGAFLVGGAWGEGELRFQASDHGITFALASPTLIETPVDQITDREVLNAMAQVLSFPEGLVASASVEMRSDRLGEDRTPVCFGKVRHEWHEDLDPPFERRKWHSYMPFWAASGRLCVTVSTLQLQWGRGLVSPSLSHDDFDF